MANTSASRLIKSAACSTVINLFKQTENHNENKHNEPYIKGGRLGATVIDFNMRTAVLCLLFSILLVFSLGKPADKKKEVKGRWYRPGNPPPANGTWNGGGGGYYFARPHPAGGWWVTPARPRPNQANQG